MTFQEIFLEVIDLHAGVVDLRPSQVKRWVNMAEAAVWNHADWTFKRVPATNLTVTAGAATEPADFGKAIRLYDPRGDLVRFLAPDDFEENYTAPVPPPSGNAGHFTVINRQIIVGPPETGTFKLAYRRRYSHLADGVTPTAGLMNSANDTPIWDPEFHYVLVPWAILLGGKLTNDETGRDLAGERDKLLEAMVNEHVRGVEKQIAVWGAD